MLKPQLEGGAGNYYDREISEKLKEFSPQQRAAHILMQVNEIHLQSTEYFKKFFT